MGPGQAWDYSFPKPPVALLRQVAFFNVMKQPNPPFSRTHRALLVARIGFLTALMAGIVFVAARDNFTSRASSKAAMATPADNDRVNTTSSTANRNEPGASTLAPVCTTDPVVVNNADSGAGSLRQAIADACDASTITFNMAMVISPISLTTAELSINKNLTINGPGSSVLTIQRSSAGGTPSFRIFTIQSVAVNISGMTISGGSGGFLNSNGTLNVTNSTVSGNSSGAGGGIASSGGTLMLTTSIVSGNTVTGGTQPSGGGIYNTGSSTATIINSTVTGNTAVGTGAGGGGLFNNSTMTLTNSTVSSNTANCTNCKGGGVANFGTLTLTNSTVNGNTSNGTNGGGGIYSQGAVTLTNSTVSGNIASGTDANGGGIYNLIGNLTLTNSTISGNVASVGGGVSSNVDPMFHSTMMNTIVANNTVGSGGIGPDVSGTFNSQDYNIIGNTSGATFTGNTAHNITGQNPLLGPLQNNGGATFTHALLAGSPALDAGADAPVTTLNGGIDSSATSINVTDASNIPANAGLTILIDTEQMVVTAKASNTLIVTRGANSTSAAAHSDGANVLAAFDQRGANFLRRRDSADVDTTAAVDIGAFEAQASVEDITDKSIVEDGSLSFGFNVGDADAITNVTASSGNTTLVPNAPANISLTGSGSTRTLNITPAANQSGASTITVTVTSGSESMSDTFVLTVTAVADTPSVTNATTNEDTQTTSGLVISRNAADGAEVTNFKITGITNGTLFKNNGTTQINNGDFITFAEGNAGLKFTPAANLFSPITTPFSFDVQGATDASGSGLSPAATATITVDPVADVPSITTATTTINTQTTSGLVISRNAVDGTEVTHFKITNITNGTLFNTTAQRRLSTTPSLPLPKAMRD